MGLESLTASLLLSANYAKIKTDELIKDFNVAVKHPVIQVLFEALGLCVIQGGVAMNKDRKGVV